MRNKKIENIIILIVVGFVLCFELINITIDIIIGNMFEVLQNPKYQSYPAYSQNPLQFIGLLVVTVLSVSFFWWRLKKVKT